MSRLFSKTSSRSFIRRRLSFSPLSFPSKLPRKWSDDDLGRWRRQQAALFSWAENSQDIIFSLLLRSQSNSEARREQLLPPRWVFVCLHFVCTRSLLREKMSHCVIVSCQVEGESARVFEEAEKRQRRECKPWTREHSVDFTPVWRSLCSAVCAVWLLQIVASCASSATSSLAFPCESSFVCYLRSKKKYNVYA